MSNNNFSIIPVLKMSLLVIAAFGLLAVSGKSVSGGPHPEAASPPPPENGAAVQEGRDHGFKFEDDALTPNINIHYTGKYCNECHETTPAEGGARYLKFDGGYDQLCRCHIDSPAAYIHPVDIKPAPEKKQRMPAGFPLQNGRVTCLTCHDIYLQCRKQLFNRNSLRGAPYSQRSDFCYRCHARETHEKLDPHRQINDGGELMIENCLICHEEKPDEKHATFAEVRFIGDIEMMCRRCHQIAGNHSGNADHMGIGPSPDGFRRIKHMEVKYNVRLPLDENGKMTCITCHNPHQKGVIPEDRPGAKGADSRYRHRLPENLCKECHQM